MRLRRANLYFWRDCGGTALQCAFAYHGRSGKPCLRNSPDLLFGDFTAMIREVLREDALRVFTEFCPLSGFRPQPGKSSVSHAAIFLGLLGSFPSSSSPQMPAPLPSGKRARRSSSTRNLLKEGEFPTSASASSSGSSPSQRLAFSGSSRGHSFAFYTVN